MIPPTMILITAYSHWSMGDSDSDSNAVVGIRIVITHTPKRICCNQNQSIDDSDSDSKKFGIIAPLM